MYRYRLRLDGCGDHYFVSEGEFNTLVDAEEFLAYIHNNYPALVGNITIEEV